MPTKPKVLWIEDSARLELANLVAPVYFDGSYDFNLAEDVTKAMRLLQTKEFDALIVDIRLPPGADPTWRALYQKAGSDKVEAQLGLKFLSWLLGANGILLSVAPPKWVRVERIAVFTVESWNEVSRDLNRMGIKIFEQKRAGHPDTVLLQLIRRLLQTANGNGAAGAHAE